MQELDFTFHFVKGSDNELDDALSRLYPNLTEIALPMTITRDALTSTSSSSSTSVAAVTVIEPATDEQYNVPQCNCWSQRCRPYPHSTVQSKPSVENYETARPFVHT